MPPRASLPRRHRGPRRRKSDPYAGTPRYTDEQCRFNFSPPSGSITTWEKPHLFYHWQRGYVHLDSGPNNYAWFRPMTPGERQATVIRRDTGEEIPASRLISYSQITATLVYREAADPFDDLFSEGPVVSVEVRQIVTTVACRVVIPGQDDVPAGPEVDDGEDSEEMYDIDDITDTSDQEEA